jgi:hypothetical protein
VGRNAGQEYAAVQLQIKQLQSFSNAVDKNKNSYKSVMIES